MSKKKMPKRSVGGVYVDKMDEYLLDILKKEKSELDFLYAFRGLNNVCETIDTIEFYNETISRLNTVKYFIEKTKKKIKKNK